MSSKFAITDNISFNVLTRILVQLIFLLRVNFLHCLLLNPVSNNLMMFSCLPTFIDWLVRDSQQMPALVAWVTKFLFSLLEIGGNLTTICLVGHRLANVWDPDTRKVMFYTGTENGAMVSPVWYYGINQGSCREGSLK